MIDRIIGIVGLALAFFAIVAPYRYPKIPRLVSDLGIAIGCILMGIVISPLILNGREEPAPATHSETAEKPKFMLKLNGGDMFSPDAKDLGGAFTGFALDATIWNTGTPSVATEWSMVIIPPGSMPVIAQFTRIPDELRLPGRVNSDVIRSSDSLELKTNTTPIQMTPIEGRLLFYIKLKQDAIKAARIEVTVKDIFGNETKVSKNMSDWMTR